MGRRVQTGITQSTKRHANKEEEEEKLCGGKESAVLCGDGDPAELGCLSSSEGLLLLITDLAAPEGAPLISGSRPCGASYSF